MSFTSSCPKCQKEVTVPDRIGAASLVRCPLCEAEFELREALALGPPALVVIEAKTDDGQPIVPVSELALAEAQPAAAGVTDDDHWTSGWAATDETATAEPAEAGGEDAVVFGEITGKLPPSEGDGTRIPPRLPGMEGGEPAQPLPRKRRRPRQEHPIRVLCGCVISALLAGAVAYWGLNLIGGPKNDMAHIRLPFCKHTSQYWCWWTPWKWHTPPVAVDLKAVATNAPRPAADPKTAAAPAPTQPAAPKPKPVADPPKPKPAANNLPDLQIKPIETFTPTFPSKPAEKPGDKAKKPNPGANPKEAESPKAKPPAEPKESAPKPPAAKSAEPPAPEEPKTDPSPDLGDGMPALPGMMPKPGQDAGPGAVPTPVKPQTPEKAKESPSKPEKPETPDSPEKPETPEAPVTPATPVAPTTPATPAAPATAEKPKTPAVSAPQAPAQPATPPAASATPPATVPGPIHPAPYEPAELATALKAAQDSFVTDLTPAACEKLRRLAEVVTLVKRPVDGALPAPQQQAIDALLRRATAKAAQTDQLAQSAAALLASPDSSGGILVTGTVTFVGVQEKLHGAAVQIAGQAKPVSVLSGRSLAVNKDDKVLILGHLVRDPAKNLAAYKGTQPVVVWALLAVKLP